jgi:Cu+-exporting ATPase
MLKQAQAEAAAINLKSMKYLFKPLIWAIFASFSLLSIYFILLNFVSGWEFTLEQFSAYWYYVLSLVIGFGIQVGLYVYLKNVIHRSEGKVVAVSGTTSTIAMISCCSHYLVNVLPIIGIVGIVSVISQYQIQLFWFGLIANFFGISYMVFKVYKIKF